MDVRLGNTDRVIIRHEVARQNVDGSITFPSQLVVVEDAETETFCVLFRSEDTPEGVYYLQWKGDHDKCLKYFIDEVTDFDADFILDRNKHNSNKNHQAEVDLERTTDHLA